MPSSTHVSSLPLPYLADAADYIDLLSSLDGLVFFDSVNHGSLRNSEDRQFDIISAAPLFTLQQKGTKCQLEQHRAYTSSWLEQAIMQLQSLIDSGASLQTILHQLGEGFLHPAQFNPEQDIPPFKAGFIGYLAYDLGRQLETLPAQANSDINIPEMHLGFYHWACVIDHKKQTAELVALKGVNDELMTTIEQKLLSKRVEKNHNKFNINNTLEDTIDVDSYRKNHARIIDYIRQGDCYQVNYTHRFSGKYSGDSWLAYRSLRQVMPGPFSAFYRSSDAVSVLSFSPERFIALHDGRVLTQPIKGTSPRDPDPARDAANANALLSSQKNRAENVMIVDLLRNDLGKCCEPGSIRADAICELKSYSNVHHLVSTVTGRLKSGMNAFDVLLHCFPGGSITGAPKIRAMEVIEELEPFRRSVYCGSLFYVDVSGNMDSNILIRTVLCENGNIHSWGGGGIVADSDWEQEYRESNNKIESLVQALNKFTALEDD